MLGVSCLVALLAALPRAVGQFPPQVDFSNVLKSPLNPDITVSYKTPLNGTCTTVYSSQKQYTGYISIPPNTLAPIEQNYSINTFFWFVEARQNPDSSPLTIYLNGGPGASSMFGLFEETGPCEVVEMSDGSYGTQARMWGWDRSSNMLFIDQPDLVGFSYDTLTNGSYNLMSGEVITPPTDVPSGQPAYTFLNGTFSSQVSSNTPNTTEVAAHSTWHFLQTWLATFPQYNPGAGSNGTVTGPTSLNLFTESYGGKYGPVFAYFFEEQNQRIQNGSLSSTSALEIQLASLGVINGLFDDLIQDYYYPLYAYNNTYGVQAISQVDELNGIQSYTQDCVPAIEACRAAIGSTVVDYGDDSNTDQLCYNAQVTCNNITAAYSASGRDVYDIMVQNPSPFPPAAYQEYLNMASVQSAIGARVNYTEESRVTQEAFISTGDTINGVAINDLAYLLSLGIRVAIINGDADFICNWYGGQAVSLALAALLPDYPVAASANNTPTPTLPQAPTTGPSSASTSSNPSSYASAFPAAGYADIVVNSTYVGGAVRQYANLSFSRIYSAGHFVPYYQPETAFTIFTRIIQGTDLSTGEVVAANFSSSGPRNATYTQSAPSDQPSPTCWVRDIQNTCSDEDISGIKAGNGVVAAGVWYSDSDDVVRPSSSVTAGVPGSLPTTSTGHDGASSSGSSVAPTGVYTATATPTPSGGAGRGCGSGEGLSGLGWFGVVVVLGLEVLL